MSFFGFPRMYGSPHHYYYDDDDDDTDHSEYSSLAQQYGPRNAARILAQQQRQRELEELQRQKEYELQQLKLQRQREAEYARRLQQQQQQRAKLAEQEKKRRQQLYKEAILRKAALEEQRRQQLQQQQEDYDSNDEYNSSQNNPFLSLFPSQAYYARPKQQQQAIPRSNQQKQIGQEMKQSKQSARENKQTEERKYDSESDSKSHCRCFYPCDCKDRKSVPPREIPIHFVTEINHALEPKTESIEKEQSREEKVKSPIETKEKSDSSSYEIRTPLREIVATVESPIQEDLLTESDAETQSIKLHALTESDTDDEDVDEVIEIKSKADSGRNTPIITEPETTNNNEIQPTDNNENNPNKIEVEEINPTTTAQDETTTHSDVNNLPIVTELTTEISNSSSQSLTSPSDSLTSDIATSPELNSQLTTPTSSILNNNNIEELIHEPMNTEPNVDNTTNLNDSSVQQRRYSTGSMTSEDSFIHLDESGQEKIKQNNNISETQPMEIQPIQTEIPTTTTTTTAVVEEEITVEEPSEPVQEIKEEIMQESKESSEEEEGKPLTLELVPTLSSKEDGYLISVPTGELEKTDLILSAESDPNRLIISVKEDNSFKLLVEPAQIELPAVADLNSISAKHESGILNISVKRIQPKRQTSFITIN